MTNAAFGKLAHSILPVIAFISSTFHDFPFFHFVFYLSIFSEQFWSNIFHDPFIKVVYIICFEVAFFLFKIATFSNNGSVCIFQVELKKGIKYYSANRKLSVSDNSQSERFFEIVESFFEKVESFFEEVESFFEKVESFFEKIESFFEKVESFFEEVESFFENAESFVLRSRGVYSRAGAMNF